MTHCHIYTYIYIYNNLLTLHVSCGVDEKTMLLIYSQAAEKAEKAAEAARTARDAAGFDGSVWGVHRGSDAVGEWRNQAEKCGKMWKKDRKSWKKMGKWN